MTKCPMCDGFDPTADLKLCPEHWAGYYVRKTRCELCYSEDLDESSRNFQGDVLCHECSAWAALALDASGSQPGETVVFWSDDSGRTAR